ncbi:MAG: DUF927 domain-containing protein [Desulfobulbaceae bacterium]|nr:DUF927 domain-containing protein [Desulfobulbaceae bacterium]
MEQTPPVTPEVLAEALHLSPTPSGELVGRCPCPAHADEHPSFSARIDDETGKILAHCHGCSDQGAVYQATVAALEKATPDTPESPTAAPLPAPVDTADAGSRKLSQPQLAARVWDKSAGNDTATVSTYLGSRGLSGTVPDTLRQAHLAYEPGSKTLLPTMVARIQGADGSIIGIHRTFLQVASDGTVTKADVPAPRKILGRAKDGFCPFGEQTDTEAIHLAEGIETSLAIHEATGAPVRASLSARNLTTVSVPEHVQRVYIWADLDRSGTGQRFAKLAADRLVKLGKEVFVLTPDIPLATSQMSIDWLDMGSAAITKALESAQPYRRTAGTGTPFDKWTIPPDYEIIDGHIFRVTVTASGEKLKRVTTGELWISGKRIDLSSRETELQLCWIDADGALHFRWLNRGLMLRRSTLLEMTELDLFPTFDSAAPETIQFLALFERCNQLPTELIARKPGWNLDPAGKWLFIAGPDCTEVQLHPESEYQPYANALAPKGDFGAWLQVMTPLVHEFPLALFGISSVLASILLRILGVPNFVVDLWGSTSIGKTTLLMVLASVWGKPSGQGGLILSWNNTQIFSERIAAFYGNGLPLFFDDSQTAKDRTIESITYMVANGQGRGRAKPYSIKETENFHVTAYSTGEKPLTEKAYPGAKARVIEIHGSPFPQIDVHRLQQLRQMVQYHYGHLVRAFLVALQAASESELRDLYDDRYRYFTDRAANEIGNRFSGYFATMAVAGRILSRIPELTDWSADLIDSALDHAWQLSTVDITETDMAQKALIGIASWIESNRARFSTTTAATELQPTYGVIRKHEGIVGFIPHIFRKALAELEIQSSAAVLAEWKSRGWLICTPGRNQKQMKLNNSPIWMICISLTALFPEGLSETDPPPPDSTPQNGGDESST